VFIKTYTDKAISCGWQGLNPSPIRHQQWLRRILEGLIYLQII